MIFLKRPGRADHLEIVTACVGPSYALLIQHRGHLDINRYNQTYPIACSECMLTNWIDPAIGPTVFIIVRQPPYVILTVTAEEQWCDDA